MESMLLRAVRPYKSGQCDGGDTVDILIDRGVISRVGRDIVPPRDIPVVDGGGKLVLPGLVEAHTHLGYSFLGLPWFRNNVGSNLQDKINAEKAEIKRRRIDFQLQAERQLAHSLALGSTFLRGHVSIDTDTGLEPLEGVLRAQEKYKELLEVQIVAFPQAGLTSRPGTIALMEEALSMGADVVGGLDPAQSDRDPKGSLDTVFGLAQKYCKPIDIHLHEPGELGGFSTDLIIERTKSLGLQGRVTISHAFCLGDLKPADIARTLDELAQNQISIMTTAPAGRACPSAAQLVRAGVTVCSGSDGVRDSWSPFSTGDMLERAKLVAMRNNFRRDIDVELALRACTFEGAAALGIADYGVEEGCSANLLVVPGETIAEAVINHPVDRIVIKGGHIVARNGSILENTLFG
ncbi:amidohydrolase family protein [Microvirga sp. BT689]|uniref:amidohydrolase family protein n=1 Tax=Microvirga arvi TaxID=2778731 RepID=UPI00194DCBD2|nr:amidohydrolase family protein [Microvirga arvi]MBM6583483.1 amidohydrolase family protein [Microvirga arvi]